MIQELASALGALLFDKRESFVDLKGSSARNQCIGWMGLTLESPELREMYNKKKMEIPESLYHIHDTVYM